MSMTLSDYIKTKNGKAASRLCSKYLSRKRIPSTECFTFSVMDMVAATIFNCDDSGYDDWEVSDKVAALSGDDFFGGIVRWIQTSEDSADILSLTADDARYDGLYSLFRWLDGEADKKNGPTPNPNRVETTEKYWDCECAENFIHPAAETHCDRCGCDKDDCPDSRVNEVREKGLPL